MSYQPIEETEVYGLACEVANRIYRRVRRWSSFDQDTMGRQLVRSIDSVGANLVEGDGRRSDPDSARFFRYARASAREARHWVRAAASRDVLESEVAESLVDEITRCARMISGLLRYRAKTETAEGRAPYDELSDTDGSVRNEPTFDNPLSRDPYPTT